ncbi:serine/threonine-protein kinase [Actinoplanes teichomyceticus]|uniref:non-specific serine/threonine protein kinase n=1 Tax=Actinoplanes teichomyceticus TaxID=1867 RepID=A0A561WB14_ACTTI|nr:serine/threonine-protein kinase [Actinoplanes teichomyceticus]
MLNDRYQLTHRIAAGGMGEVWRGGDLLLRREIGVKVLLPALMSDREFITRFRSEARMMAQLRHPGVVQVYDYGENAVVDGERFDYLVMEFIEGTSLSNRIQQAGRLSPAETMTLTAGVADALHAAHQAGIIHRDVKPANLLVRPNGAIVLVDFGVARSLGVTGITSTNVVMGSVNYMAPEQAEGRPVTAATDVYALGAVAYACLTGRPPYVGDNPLAVLTQLVHGQPPVLPPDVPRAVAAVVMRALAKDPAQRFPSGAAFADAARNAGRAPHGGPVAPTGAWGAPTVPHRAAPPSGPHPAMPPTSAHPATPPTGPHRPMPATGPHRPTPATGPHRPTPATGPHRPMPATAVQAAVPPSGPHPAGAAFGAAAPPDFPAAAEPAGRGRRRNPGLVAAAAGLILVGGGVLLAVWPDSADTQQPQVTAGAGQQAQPGPTGKPARPTPTRKRAEQTTEPDDEPADAVTPEESEEDEPDRDTPLPEEDARETDPGEACGGGYEPRQQTDLTSAGAVQGRVHLLYRDSDASYCVVTVRTAGLERKAAASAYLQVQGQDRITDSGPVQYFAGPVTATAPGTCVKFGGSIGPLTFDSDFVGCE